MHIMYRYVHTAAVLEGTGSYYSFSIIYLYNVCIYFSSRELKMDMKNINYNIALYYVLVKLIAFTTEQFGHYRNLFCK